ncbi:MAG: hypothetical protein CM1200mP29_00870 [Verrucomicrobiota bacterium]|nr:MAG: hypothetical protein CM1200mP29_00870 [Verrucomicrobiota bacterium]
MAEPCVHGVSNRPSAINLTFICDCACLGVDPSLQGSLRSIFLNVEIPGTPGWVARTWPELSVMTEEGCGGSVPKILVKGGSGPSPLIEGNPDEAS